MLKHVSRFALAVLMTLPLMASADATPYGLDPALFEPVNTSAFEAQHVVPSVNCGPCDAARTLAGGTVGESLAQVGAAASAVGGATQGGTNQ